MYEFLTLVPKETCQKSNFQEPIGSTYDHLKLILKNIRHVRTHNNIATPFIINTHETDITQKCSSMHHKYIDTIKIGRHQNLMQTSS